MKSTLTIALALLALVGVVFGITIIATHTPPAPEQVGGGGSNEDEAPSGPALNFASQRMMYAPESDDLSSRFFPGVFEVSDVHVPVSFWFQNPHKVPVRVTALSRSCTACSAARVAVFSESSMKDLQTRAAMASLPASAFGPPNLLLSLAMVDLLKTAEWRDLDFEHPDRGTDVPPRAADGTPTWGIFQVGIQVRGIGAQPKEVTIGMTPGKAPQQKLPFAVMLAGAPPFNIYPATLPLGDLPEGTSPRTTTIYYFSATRGPGTLPPPIMSGYDPNDPFFQVSPPTPMTPAECSALEQSMSSTQRGIRVTAGYKFNVTVHRRRSDRTNGPTEPDIGPFIRDIDVTGQGTGHSAKLPVTASISGLVELTDKQEKIDLGSFPIANGVEKRVTLATTGTSRPDLVLEVDKEKTSPPILTVTLTPDPRSEVRKYWTLTAAIPPGLSGGGDLPRDSFVVLRAKTSEGTRLVRIPVTGRGRGGR